MTPWYTGWISITPLQTPVLTHTGVQLQKSKFRIGMWDWSPLPHVLCTVWLSTERLDKSGRCSGLCQRHKCENADSAAKDRRWAADCRFDHSSKLCVSSCKSPVNFRPVSAARSATKTAVATASPTEHHQLEQPVRSSGVHRRCWVLWEHTTCIKIRDSFQRILFIFNFSCAL